MEHAKESHCSPEHSLGKLSQLIKNLQKLQFSCTQLCHLQYLHNYTFKKEYISWTLCIIYNFCKLHLLLYEFVSISSNLYSKDNKTIDEDNDDDFLYNRLRLAIMFKCGIIILIIMMEYAPAYDFAPSFICVLTESCRIIK